MSTEFTVQTSKQPKMNGGSNRGTLQVDIGTEDVHLWGSIITGDATIQSGWVLIHSFSVDSLKEVTLAPNMCVSGSANSVTASIGTSAAYLKETR
jgi:hypothetical protein